MYPVISIARGLVLRTILKSTLRIGLIGLGFTGALVGSAVAGTTTYQYDSLGRIIKVVYPDLKHICYAYDSAGNRTQVKRQATGSCTVTGSTLTSSLTAESMFAAQQNDDATAGEAAVTDVTTAVENQGATDSATLNSYPTDEGATTN